MRTVLLIPACGLAAWLTWLAAPQTATRLWVLVEPGELVEFDAVTFAPKGRIAVPAAAIEHPERLSVNRRGQTLFVPGEEPDDDAFAPGSAASRIWLWSGREAAQLDRGASRRTTREGATLAVVETAPACFLSSDGQRLYWFANEFTKRQDPEGGPERSVTTVYRVWQTDLAGAGRRTIAEHAFAPCACETGTCSETCPEGDLWAPAGGIGDFFLLTHWVPGQLGATFADSFLHRRTPEGWRVSRLPRPLEDVLDAARGGDLLLTALPDSACCGWDNDSNDQTVVIRGGTAATVFDERARYGNANYDVTFHTPSARLSPDFTSVAMTIAASTRAGDEIRLSSEGRADVEELARVRHALAGVPAVEVFRLGDRPRRIASIPRAVLAGWLSSREILILERDVLVAVGVADGRRRETRIRVPEASRVFLR